MYFISSLLIFTPAPNRLAVSYNRTGTKVLLGILNFEKCLLPIDFFFCSNVSEYFWFENLTNTLLFHPCHVLKEGGDDNSQPYSDRLPHPMHGNVYNFAFQLILWYIIGNIARFHVIPSTILFRICLISL